MCFLADAATIWTVAVLNSKWMSVASQTVEAELFLYGDLPSLYWIRILVSFERVVSFVAKRTPFLFLRNGPTLC